MDVCRYYLQYFEIYYRDNISTFAHFLLIFDGYRYIYDIVDNFQIFYGYAGKNIFLPNIYVNTSKMNIIRILSKNIRIFASIMCMHVSKWHQSQVKPSQGLIKSSEAHLFLHLALLTFYSANIFIG